MNELTTEQLLLKVESLTINDDRELQNANELAKQCNAKIKEIDSLYKPQKQELDRQKKQLIKLEKEEKAVFENCKNVIKDAILEHQKQLEVEQETEIKKFGFAVQKETKLQGTHIRKKWKARVVGVEKVPLHYKKLIIRPVDEKILNEIAVHEMGRAEIPGVEFYQEESVVIR